MSGRPRVGVVVLDFGRPDEAERAAQSAMQDMPEARLLIVENGPQPGHVGGASLSTVERLRLPENRGFAGGMNAGLTRLVEDGCDRLLLLNNDAVLEPRCLSLLCAALDDPSLAAAGPAILRAADGRVESAGIRVDLSVGRVRLEGHGREVASLGLEAGCREVQALSGAVVMISRAALDRVGPLDDESFFSFEDVDWCLRARRAGYRLAVIGGARALHVGALSVGRASSDRLYYATRNHLRLVERHQPMEGIRRWLRRGAVLCLNVGHSLRQGEIAPVAGVRAVLEGFRDACRARGGPRPRPARSGGG